MKKRNGDLGEREKAVENLVKPIREALDASRLQIDALEKSRREAYGGIRAQLEIMQTSQHTLQQETKNLVNALRRPEVRGRWGEITLRRLVELAGMVEHCDFQEQVHTPGEDSKHPSGHDRTNAGSSSVGCRRQGDADAYLHDADRKNRAWKARPECPRSHPYAGAEELLAAVRGESRIRHPVHSRRSVPERRPQRASRPDRIRAVGADYSCNADEFRRPS